MERKQPAVSMLQATSCGAVCRACDGNQRNAVNDGLGVVQQLHPIRFDWKEDGWPDIGLGAEDVAKVAPSLVFITTEGEVRSREVRELNLLLINSIQEQQEQIDALHTTNDANARLEAVEKALRRD